MFYVVVVGWVAILLAASWFLNVLQRKQRRQNWDDTHGKRP